MISIDKFKELKFSKGSPHLKILNLATRIFDQFQKTVVCHLTLVFLIIDHVEHFLVEPVDFLFQLGLCLHRLLLIIFQGWSHIFYWRTDKVWQGLNLCLLIGSLIGKDIFYMFDWWLSELSHFWFSFFPYVLIDLTQLFLNLITLVLGVGKNPVGKRLSILNYELKLHSNSQKRSPYICVRNCFGTRLIFQWFHMNFSPVIRIPLSRNLCFRWWSKIKKGFTETLVA